MNVSVDDELTIGMRMNLSALLLIARGGGAWNNQSAHNQGWRIVGEDELRHVMRCTGWKESR